MVTSAAQGKVLFRTVAAYGKAAHSTCIGLGALDDLCDEVSTSSAGDRIKHSTCHDAPITRIGAHKIQREDSFDPRSEWLEPSARPGSVANALFAVRKITIGLERRSRVFATWRLERS